MAPMPAQRPQAHDEHLSGRTDGRRQDVGRARCSRSVSARRSSIPTTRSSARPGYEIPVIFEIEGEAGFRAREDRMLAELVRRGNIVLATGGGAVLSDREPRAARRERHRRLPARGAARPLAAHAARSQPSAAADAGDPLAKLERTLRRARSALPRSRRHHRRHRRAERGQPRAQARAQARASSPGRGETARDSPAPAG